jgi:hypothetical protein
MIDSDELRKILHSEEFSVDEVLTHLKNMIEAAWTEYAESKRAIDKHRFLKLIPEAAKIYVELLQSVGYAEKASASKKLETDENELFKKVFEN